jgi:hypothetical protein
VQGVLAKEEFDARIGQAFASRTQIDLAAITADLPAGLSEAGSARPTVPACTAGLAGGIGGGRRRRLVLK